MAINQISDADIREYLLGTLAVEDVELLDQLSFTDEFAERIGSIEHDLVDDYVAGRLEGEERLAFEGHYLSSPHRRNKVDFARAFAAFSAREGTSAEQLEANLTIWDTFRTWRMRLHFGMAAAGLLAIAVFGWLAYRTADSNGEGGPIVASVQDSPLPPGAEVPVETPGPVSSVTPTLAQNEPVVNRTQAAPEPSKTRPRTPEVNSHPPRPRPAIIILTPALRSASFQNVKIPEGSRVAEFRLSLESDASGPYTAEIFDTRGQARIWSAKGIKASGVDTDRRLNIRVPANLLGRGDYNISIFVRDKDGRPEKVGDYFFRVAP